MVSRNIGTIVISVIVGLAVVGLVSSLLKNPGSFLLSILITVVIATILFFILRAVLRNKNEGNSDQMKKYRKAVKQSKNKYQAKDTKMKQKQAAKVSKSSAKTKPKKKRHFTSRKRSHLRVIEGKKGLDKDKNDRASN